MRVVRVVVVNRKGDEGDDAGCQTLDEVTSGIHDT